MNTLIRNPRAHRAAWTKAHPEAMIERGGLLSAEDLERWACDNCMAPLDPDSPIVCFGGPEGYSLCKQCIAKLPPEQRCVSIICECAGCGKLTPQQKAVIVALAPKQPGARLENQ